VLQVTDRECGPVSCAATVTRPSSSDGQHQHKPGPDRGSDCHAGPWPPSTSNQLEASAQAGARQHLSARKFFKWLSNWRFEKIGSGASQVAAPCADLPAVERDAVSTGTAADSADWDQRLKGLPRLLRYAMLLSDNASYPARAQCESNKELIMKRKAGHKVAPSKYLTIANVEPRIP
jgi:hypothetical protein